MNLVIDAGNSFIKFGIFEGTQLLHSKRILSKDFTETLISIRHTNPQLEAVIISSVGTLSKNAVTQLQKTFPTALFLDNTTKMPFTNCYTSPTTLGVDRLALVAAAAQCFPKQNTLVIDAGTCITYDFKNNKEEYLGGAIAPGLQMRYQSLHDFTANLPLLTSKFPQNDIGTNTNESIHVGVSTGLIHEIKGVIRQYCNTYDDLTVILTGGDAHFLSKRLKNGIFATSNFLLEGLNYILAFNTTQ